MNIFMNEHKRETRREEAGKQKQIKQFLKVGLSLKKRKSQLFKNVSLLIELKAMFVKILMSFSLKFVFAKTSPYSSGTWIYK